MSPSTGLESAVAQHKAEIRPISFVDSYTLAHTAHLTTHGAHAPDVIF